MPIRGLITECRWLHRDQIMSEFDPRRQSMRKLTVAVAAALALGTVVMAAGTTAFARGGAHFASGRFGGGFRGSFGGVYGFGRGWPYYGYGYGSCYVLTPYGYASICP